MPIVADLRGTQTAQHNGQALQAIAVGKVIVWPNPPPSFAQPELTLTPTPSTAEQEFDLALAWKNLPPGSAVVAWGDGDSERASPGSVSHRYRSPGKYTITVRVDTLVKTAVVTVKAATLQPLQADAAALNGVISAAVADGYIATPLDMGTLKPGQQLVLPGLNEAALSGLGYLAMLVSDSATGRPVGHQSSDDGDGSVQARYGSTWTPPPTAKKGDKFYIILGYDGHDPQEVLGTIVIG